MIRFVYTAVLLAAAPFAYAAPVDSAVHIKVETETGASYGSGTVVACENEKSLILSCAHVIYGPDRKVTITLKGKKYAAKWLAGSAVKEVANPDGTKSLEIDGPDLCLLVVDAELPVATVGKTAVADGDKVHQWGFAGGRLKFGPFYKTGVVTEAEGIWSTADARGGDSGSGLFNDDNELIGVVHARPVDVDEPAGLAISLDVVRKFLKEKAKGFDGFQKQFQKD
jgi:V8-like Glu-specific endopeptidase